jgi:hypothetical protein
MVAAKKKIHAFTLSQNVSIMLEYTCVGYWKKYIHVFLVVDYRHLLICVFKTFQE